MTLSTNSKAVNIANKTPSARLATVISLGYQFHSFSCRVQVAHKNDLKKAQREAIWSIFEKNMRQLYDGSSFGWQPVNKKNELFHSLSRYILIYGIEPSELLAFLHFRFEVEEEEDILYCYDIQIKPSAQGVGMGKKLIEELVKLCREFEMTSLPNISYFAENERALAFYKSIGFTVDPTSPGYLGSDEEIDPEVDNTEADYEIMSKPIIAVQ